jgi:BolA protein
MKPDTLTHLRQELEEALTPSYLEIVDESSQHIGHAGARQGGHYKVIIASPCFEGLSIIACHRKIYEVLDPLSDRGIHALSIQIKR